MIGRRAPRLILIAFCVLVVSFLIAPTVLIMAMSFGSTRSLNFPPHGFSVDWYRNFFEDRWLTPTITSLKVAALAALTATALGTMAALGIMRGRFPGRSLVQGILLAPLIVPVVIVGIALFSVFSDWHLAGTLWGLVLGHTVLAIPFVLITVGASLQTVDPVYERAAANLGAPPLRVFLRVTLPLILPGVVAGGLFAFAVSLDEVVVAIFLTSPTVHHTSG